MSQHVCLGRREPEEPPWCQGMVAEEDAVEQRVLDGAFPDDHRGCSRWEIFPGAVWICRDRAMQGGRVVVAGYNNNLKVPPKAALGLPEGGARIRRDGVGMSFALCLGGFQSRDSLPTPQ